MYNCHSESKYPRKYEGLRVVQSGSLAARHGLCLGTTLSGGEPITAQWPALADTGRVGPSEFIIIMK